MADDDVEALDLVDLHSGNRRTPAVPLAPGAVLRSPRWSPDGHLVVTVDTAGHVVVVDAESGRTRLLVPGSVLPVVEDVALRASSRR